MKLTSNTILITGGSSGIGLALAQRLSSLGNKLIICGRRADRLEAAKQNDPTIDIKVCDVSSETQRIELVQWLKSHHPDLNVVVNNAGIQFKSIIGSTLNMNQVRQEIETNILAGLHLSDLVVPLLQGKANATIINVSSGLAFVPLAFMTVYCATRAFVHSMTMSMRFSLRQKGIEVIEIIPPSVDTELGKERRTDPSQSHGGMPIETFIQEAFQGLEAGSPEVIVGLSSDLRQKGELMFEQMNQPFVEA